MILEKYLEKNLFDTRFHAQWLNTLSCMENCGARLIARSEHPTMVTREILKHAAEEFRHAYYLKSLIHKVHSRGIENYAPNSLIGGLYSLRYLDKINVGISRFLKSQYHLCGAQLKTIAYLLVTYAIEVRALELYRIYEELLQKQKHPISIKSIIREEVHHLAEVTDEIEQIPEGTQLTKHALGIESVLYDQWVHYCCM